MIMEGMSRLKGLSLLIFYGQFGDVPLSFGNKKLNPLPDNSEALDSLPVGYKYNTSHSLSALSH